MDVAVNPIVTVLVTEYLRKFITVGDSITAIYTTL